MLYAYKKTVYLKGKKIKKEVQRWKRTLWYGLQLAVEHVLTNSEEIYSRRVERTKDNAMLVEIKTRSKAVPA